MTKMTQFMRKAADRSTGLHEDDKREFWREYIEY
jgi:hypothetical protein